MVSCKDLGSLNFDSNIFQVITEPTPWDGGLVAVNSFGVGGANGHALLLSNKKIKKIVPDSIPRLICVSGVTEHAVETMINKVPLPSLGNTGHSRGFSLIYHQ